jgi:uroporphyrinogen-III synthase
MGFGGLKVLSLESRRSREMEALIRREGGEPFVAPSVQERALDDHREAAEFVSRLDAGEFDLVVCMTGAGLAFLRDLAVREGTLEKLSAGMRRAFIVARGPKPLPTLRELGAKAHIVVPEPNTWKEVVDAIATRPERRIAVQEYGRPNPAMTAALEAQGAHVSCFAIYRWEMPADMEPLRKAARRIASRDIDVVLFTSSIQLDHLFETAEELGVRSELQRALAQHTLLASVGPIMSEALMAAGLPVDIVPIHPKMAALVKAASDNAVLDLALKRGAAGRSEGSEKPRFTE